MITRWPSSRSARARQSPKIVERIWPTCMGLATFGELKSTTKVRGWKVFEKKRWSPRAAACSDCTRAEVLSRKFRKPAPAISTFSHHSDTASLATTSVASWRGFNLRSLASAINALVWKSPNLGSRQGRTRTEAGFASGRIAVTACCKCCSRRWWGNTEMKVKMVVKLWRCSAESKPAGDYFLPCSLMMRRIVSASGASSRAWRNSFL